MEFVPAGEIIGEAHQVRTVTISEDPVLPDGEYSFVDAYCTDAKCDCRKTMIYVMHNGEYVALLDYGWEKLSYYRKWLRDPEGAKEMAGLSVNPMGPHKVDSGTVLALFKTLLNNKYELLFRRHYRLVKKAVKDGQWLG